MRFRKSPVPPEPGFDLTPMIDIVLLLIIFFVMTAQFARTSNSPLDLPRFSGEAGVPPGEHSIVIDLDAAGRLSVLGVGMDLAQVTRTVKDAVASSKVGVDVLVRADRAAKSSHLNRLAAALAAGGVRQWKIATAGASDDGEGGNGASGGGAEDSSSPVGAGGGS
jgi:biopolymer transport protein ExbD